MNNMADNRLYGVLESFSKQDWKDFDRFVRSPFFNRQQILIEFMNYLREYFKVNRRLPTNEQLFKALYPDRIFEDVRIRLIISNLYKLIEQYLVHSILLKENDKSQLILLDQYQKRNLPKYFERNVKQYTKKMKTRDCKDVSYFEHLAQLKIKQTHHDSAHKKRTNDFKFQSASDAIDLAYISLKLKETCLLLSHQTIYKKEYELGMLNAILEHIEAKKLLNIPTIAVYYYCYHLMHYPTRDDNFIALKSLILKEAIPFTDSDLKDIYIIAINFCIKKINKGTVSYKQELYFLYKKGLEKGYLITDGILSRFTYRNITTMGIMAEDYDWVEAFLSKYKNFLEKKYRTDNYAFNLAMVKYTRQDYDSALQLLNQADYKDALLMLAAKAVLLKIYYELDEYDLLESHLDAMAIFIRRKHSLGYHRDNYKKLIYYTRKLLELDFYNKNAVKLLKTTIVETTGIAERSWLLKQLD